MTVKKEDLSKLRESIDDIDNQIISLLKKRMNIVEDVKKYKIKNYSGENFIKSGREASMLRDLIKKAKDIFPPQAIATIWRMIISTSLSHEQDMSIISYVTEQNNSCYWLAREYYGSFSQIDKSDSIEYIIENIVNKKYSLAILPVSEKNKKPWWIRPLNEKNDIFIFASIPFVKYHSCDIEPVFVIANLKPEKTGEDFSIAAIESDRTEKNLLDLFEKEGLSFNLINANKNCYLLEITGFLETDDIRIKNISKILTEEGANFKMLGNIAKPILY